MGKYGDPGGCETWAMNKDDDKCEQAFAIWCYWRLTRSSWIDKVNKQLLKSAIKKTLLVKILNYEKKSHDLDIL